jgi:tripartite ATP-independent transporter DctP family solute receptor
MLKRSVRVLCLLTAALLLTASGVCAAAKHTIIFNGPMPESHNLTKAERMFAKLVEERTKGDVAVKVHINAVLGGGREALEAVKVGTQTMVDAALAPVFGFEPAFGVLNLPYLFTSRKQWYELLDGPLGTELLTMLEKLGFVGLGYPENGIRHVTNNVRPITKPEDLKGIKIRVMQSPVFISTFKTLGGLPTAIPWAELYSALQQGVVDAQENPVVNIYGAKLYEVQKFLSLTAHTYDPNVYFMNKKFFDSLPKDYQTVIRSTAKEVIAWQRVEAQKDEQTQLTELKSKMKVNELAKEQLEAFRQSCQPVYAEQAKTIGQAVVDKWLKAVTGN